MAERARNHTRAAAWLLLLLSVFIFLPSPAKAHRSGKFLGTFHVTYYYFALEIAGGNWPLYGVACQTIIARTSKTFHDLLSLEGAGRLKDGRVVGFEERCDCAKQGFQGRRTCYSLLDKTLFPWGRGGRIHGQFVSLRPFRSVAVDPNHVPLGTVLFIPEFKGKRLPNGKRLDGCFRAEDTGALIQGKKLDVFSGFPDWGKQFQKANPLDRIKVFEGGERCPTILLE